MKFSEFYEIYLFQWFRPKTVPNPYEFHYFSALGETDDFLDFFRKYENIWKREKIRIENMEITGNLIPTKF